MGIIAATQYIALPLNPDMPNPAPAPVLPAGRRPLRLWRLVAAVILVLVLVASVAGGLLLWHELNTSRLQAREIAAVEIPQQLTVGLDTAILRLNGAGIRTRFVSKVHISARADEDLKQAMLGTV